MGELDLRTPEATRQAQSEATKPFPQERQAKRDLLLNRVKEIGPIPSVMEPELEADFLGPVILGNFREDFAHYIRNGETLVCVQASTNEAVELAVDTLKQYAPVEVKVVPSAEDSDP